jgi:hypothetical protein
MDRCRGLACYGGNAWKGCGGCGGCSAGSYIQNHYTASHHNGDVPGKEDAHDNFPVNQFILINSMDDDR